MTDLSEYFNDADGHFQQPSLTTQMAVADAYPFIGGELLETHGSACVEFVGADAHFGAEAENKAVGEAC